MSSELEFYTDQDGLPCARGDDERIATYLQTDIQGSPSIAEELIALLENPSFEGDFSGNAHVVDFRANSVAIEATYDEEAPDRVVSREEMLGHVRAWLAFISTPSTPA